MNDKKVSRFERIAWMMVALMLLGAVAGCAGNGLGVGMLHTLALILISVPGSIFTIMCALRPLS